MQEMTLFMRSRCMLRHGLHSTTPRLLRRPAAVRYAVLVRQATSMSRAQKRRLAEKPELEHAVKLARDNDAEHVMQFALAACATIGEAAVLDKRALAPLGELCVESATGQLLHADEPALVLLLLCFLFLFM